MTGSHPQPVHCTQLDPIGLAGGLNSYGFAAGDPINFSDPFGLMVCPPMCGFEGDPKNVEREAQMVQSRTAGDNLAMLAIVGAGATASVGLMSVSARLMATAAATAAPFADQVARQAGAVAGTVLDKMQAAGRMVGAARLGAERAANELGSAITKMGYEFSRVSVAGQEYITAARATAGRFNAIGVNADGSTFNAVLQVGAKGALEVVK